MSKDDWRNDKLITTCQTSCMHDVKRVEKPTVEGDRRLSNKPLRLYLFKLLLWKINYSVLENKPKRLETF